MTKDWHAQDLHHVDAEGWCASAAPRPCQCYLPAPLAARLEVVISVGRWASASYMYDTVASLPSVGGGHTRPDSTRPASHSARVGWTSTTGKLQRRQTVDSDDPHRLLIHFYSTYKATIRLYKTYHHFTFFYSFSFIMHKFHGVPNTEFNNKTARKWNSTNQYRQLICTWGH